MKITDIKQQVKREGRYSIFVDKKYDFALTANELLNFGLKIGDEFTSEEYNRLKQKAVIAKAYDQAIGQLARRPRSEWELRDYLKRKEYSSGVVDNVIEKLRVKKYVDDFAFAQSWVRNRRLLKSTSKRKLTMELKTKRVSDDVISDVISEDVTDEQEVLKELIKRKQQQTRYQDIQKLTSYLLRQGFDYQDIKLASQTLKED